MMVRHLETAQFCACLHSTIEGVILFLFKKPLLSEVHQGDKGAKGQALRPAPFFRFLTHSASRTQRTEKPF